ncbi:MAG TPA: GDSL-type esterase/lipase family protein [Planctomycetota bacterium]|nr:GDSL-type esterase/lipase family protein [Planctomycetota bacterium]HRR80043.1 GDSL-type esterase/lipase family protein [Planctomycetota bacterium]HRT93068.1 GDSL-type esterase/lipase family protein [Planctomycetota bacterium]
MKHWMRVIVLLVCLATAARGADDWVEPMKAVHARFTGQAGTVAQFGDSITITMAFFTPLSMDHKNVPDDLKEAHAWLRKYVQPRCWRAWKGPQFGNEGRTTTDWGLAGIAGWLKKLNPEVALVMWGTNDTYQGPKPPKYTDNLRLIIQACLDNGTVPILYTIPPKGDQAGNAKNTAHVETFVEAARTVAAEKKVPLVDFYKEMMSRQPTEFHKTLLGDGLHPSYPKEYQQDFSEEALKQSGYTLRNYLTLKALWEVYQKVLSQGKPAKAEAGDAAAPKGPTYKGRPAVLVARPAAEPKVDGSLDDPCWAKAQALTFRMLDGSTDKPKHATTARLLANETTLFVAFQCGETEPLVSRKRDRDDNIWEDDSVEVFLKPGPEPAREYHHLIVNPDGSFLDDLGGDNGAWQSELKLATAKGKEGWAAEIAIPLAELTKGADKATLAGPWRLNLARMRQSRGDDVPAEETALAPTEDPSSHVPAMFAYAWFEALGGKLPAE